MDISNVEIRIVGARPEVYETLHERFGVEWDNGIIITVYPNIHCRFPLPPDKIVHEAVHLVQQKEMGADIWWHRWLAEPGFRLDQEAAAHRKEADFVRKSIKDRNDRDKFIRDIAKNLSGPIYGNLISYGEALALLK